MNEPDGIDEMIRQRDDRNAERERELRGMEEGNLDFLIYKKPDAPYSSIIRQRSAWSAL